LDNLSAYRMHVPKWAAMPLSGEGAAQHGGRANRPGIAAIYLALEIETAVKEYQQVSSLLPPGTLIAYQITLESVVDFRNGFDASIWEPIWEDFHCDWRELWFNQRIEPPSWVIGDVVIAAGASGILFRSRLVEGGANLVIYPAMLATDDAISVFDPSGTLPKNQDSWV